MSKSDSTSIPYGYCHCGCGQKTNLYPQNFLAKGQRKGEPRQFIHGHNGRRYTHPAEPEYRAWWAANTDVPFGYCWCGCGEKTTLSPKHNIQNGHVKGQPRRFVGNHSTRMGYSRLKVPYVEENHGYSTPCWIWQGATTHGYGIMGVPGTKRTNGAHRIYYEQRHGPIPAGLVLHHLCENPPCVNPDHLEPMTQTRHISEMHRRR